MVPYHNYDLKHCFTFMHYNRHFYTEFNFAVLLFEVEEHFFLTLGLGFFSEEEEMYTLHQACIKLIKSNSTFIMLSIL